MKRLSIIFFAAALLALAVAPVLAAPGGNIGGGLIAGGGWRIAPENSNFPGDPRVEFKVAAKFAAATASGTYQYANVAGGYLTVPIACGGVSGATAVIGGYASAADIPDLIGEKVLVFFVDNGTPTFGSLGPDQVSFTLVSENGTFVAGDNLGEDFPSDFPAHCPAAQGDTFQNQQLVTVLGDIAVH